MAMARSRRIQTAEKTFVFDLAEAGESSVRRIKYLDLGQVHALVNRLSARQGFEYVVQSIEIGCQSGGSFVASIYKLPEHWPCINAWEKTMRHWDSQQREAADEAGVESTAARYRDFKIFFDAGHANAGVGANLIPNGFTAAAPATGGYQWNPSQVVLPNAGGPGVAVEYYLHMLGDDNAGANPSKGMILAYAESRSRPFDDEPNIVDVASGGLFGEMVDVGSDMGEIVGNLQDHNRQPPYVVDLDTADEYYPGGSAQGIGPLDAGGIVHPGELVDVLSIGASQNFNTDTAASFVAPCGLIKIEYFGSGVLPASPPTLNYVPAFWLKVTLAPGDYKGLLAQSMQEAN